MLKKVSKEIEELYYKLCVCLGEESVKISESNLVKRPYLKNALLNKILYNNNFNSFEELKEYIEQLKAELGIKSKEDIGCYTLADLESKIGILASELSRIQRENLPKIQSVAPEFEKIFLDNLPKDASDEDKINYLVNYIARTIDYSEAWFKYSERAQAGLNGQYCIKDGIPTLRDKDEVIVVGQGVCLDISEYAKNLGAKVGLNIDVEHVSYNTFSHQLNLVRLSNGSYSNFDITRLIRDDKTPSQCILLSNSDLLQQKGYKDLRNGNIETETVSREYVETFYEKHKELIDRMVAETLELRNRVINDVTFDFPVKKDCDNELNSLSSENSILHK